MNDVYLDSSFSVSRSHVLFRYYIQTLPRKKIHLSTWSKISVWPHRLLDAIMTQENDPRRDVQSIVTPGWGSTRQSVRSLQRLYNGTALPGTPGPQGSLTTAKSPSRAALKSPSDTLKQHYSVCGPAAVRKFMF